MIGWLAREKKVCDEGEEPLGDGYREEGGEAAEAGETSDSEPGLCEGAAATFRGVCVGDLGKGGSALEVGSNFADGDAA